MKSTLSTLMVLTAFTGITASTVFAQEPNTNAKGAEVSTPTKQGAQAKSNEIRSKKRSGHKNTEKPSSEVGTPVEKSK